MPEESGSVAIKASDEITKMLGNEATSHDAMKQLGQAAGFSEDELDELHSTWDRFVVRNGYAKFNFNCVNWKRLSQLFVEKGKGFEWYALVHDEYGAVDFFLLNEAGERLHFSFDYDGDLSDEEWYQDEVRTNIKKWKSAIPDALKTVFPDFVETEHYEV